MEYTVISYLPAQFLGLSLGVTQDVLSVANDLAERQGLGSLNLVLASANGGVVSSFSQLKVLSEARLNPSQRPDLLVIHPWWGSFSDQLANEQLFIEVLPEWHCGGTIIAAPTTASYFLAQAGLLEQRQCTTHWHKHEDFQKRFPKAILSKERHITVADGLYCSSGMQAGLEILIHILKEWFGSDHASLLEETFMPDFKHMLSNEFLAMASNYQHDDADIMKCQQWLELNYAAPVTVTGMAQRANMSERSFKRRFKLATGMPPLQYLQRLRIEQGRQYLSTTKRSVADVSWRVGYEDAGHFARLFERHYGCTPNDWRKRQPLTADGLIVRK